MNRALSLYVVLSAIALILCIAETILYAQRLQQSYGQIQTINADMNNSNKNFTAAVTDKPLTDSIPATANIQAEDDDIDLHLPSTPITAFESFASPFLAIPNIITLLHHNDKSDITYGYTDTSIRLLLAFFFRWKLNSLLFCNLLLSCCCLILRLILAYVFGFINDGEKKACRENLFNFLLFRSVFIAAIVPLEARELLVWITFFTIIAMMRIICVVARERFATVTILPSATRQTFIQILILIGGIIIVDLLFALILGYILYLHTGASVTALLLFEHMIILLGCIKVGSKYLIHLKGLNRSSAWEERNSYLYFTDFISECIIQICTILHYLHVWSFYGLSVTIIDLFLFLHVRSSCVVLLERLSKYHHYRRASVEINSRYADATAEELRAADDFCAICRESMETAKKLGCGHLFHKTCITQWMEYKSICPSCRTPLVSEAQRRQQHQPQQNVANMYPAQAAAHINANRSTASTSGANHHIPATTSTSSSNSSHASSSQVINDDNLEATMALIQQLQAQDAAQFSTLGLFGLRTAPLNSNTQVNHRGNTNNHLGLDTDQNGHPSATALNRGFVGRSLFQFNWSLASWLPAFSLQILTSEPDRAIPTPTIPTASIRTPATETNATAGRRYIYNPQPRDNIHTSHQGSDRQRNSTIEGLEEHKESMSTTNIDIDTHSPALEATIPSSSTASSSSSLSSVSSDGSRRDVMFAAAQRRLNQNGTSASPVSATFSSPNPSLSPHISSSSATSSTSIPTSSSSSSSLSDSELDDSAFDDINHTEPEEWSDEEAIAARISQVLTRRHRQVQHTTMPTE